MLVAYQMVKITYLFTESVKTILKNIQLGEEIKDENIVVINDKRIAMPVEIQPTNTFFLPLIILKNAWFTKSSQNCH